MKKLLYGTTNPAKLKFMREMLQELGLEIIGLKDIDREVEAVDESGNNPLENAKIKALAYYKATNMPVFSCDTGLYIEGVSDEKQPGVHVRRVGGKELSDEEMIEYYTKLVREHGGTVKAKYKNAIVLVLEENKIFEYDGEDIWYPEFLLTSEVHPSRTEGFPLDSISLEIKTKQYFMDMEAEDNSSDDSITKGFQSFFKRKVF
jgi:8-oxo-dGTP diphosphatase